METSASSPLKNLERHDIGWFNCWLLSRRESIEDTLRLFDMTDLERNVSLLSRTTHLYKATQKIFSNLRETLVRNNEFVHVEILHESSDLGVSYKILAKHSNGKQIVYDGIQFHVSELIRNEGFALQDIEKFAPYYDICVQNALAPFQNSLREVLSELPEFTFPSYSFYTAEVTNWEILGLRNGGNAHLRLICTDKNVITMTGLVYTEIGKDYHTYLGDTKIALQMIAHEEFHAMEIYKFMKYFDEQRSIIREIQIGTEKETKALVMPFYKFIQRHTQWNRVKEDWKTIRGIYSRMPRGDLLIQAYEEMLKKEQAFFNAPKQLWLADEVQDDQEQIAYPTTNFYGAKLQNSKLEGISDKPIQSRYGKDVKELKTIVRTLKDEIAPVIDDEKNLLTIFQTEFSLYAVWFAIFAVIVSVIAILITIFTSR
jgi:hypothetical protein